MELETQEGFTHPSSGAHHLTISLKTNEEYGPALFTNLETQMLQDCKEAHLAPDPPLFKPINPQNSKLSNFEGE